VTVAGMDISMIGLICCVIMGPMDVEMHIHLI
jgi:hypothetical protein